MIILAMPKNVVLLIKTIIKKIQELQKLRIFRNPCLLTRIVKG